MLLTGVRLSLWCRLTANQNTNLALLWSKPYVGNKGVQWNPVLWPPSLYDYLVVKTIIFWPKLKNHWVILFLEDLVDTTNSLLWPGFYGPMVVALRGFHCILLLNNVYCLSLSGEGKLISKDGTVYEGSFHNHRRHGEGKLMFRLGAVITQAQNRPYSWYPLSLHVLKDV